MVEQCGVDGALSSLQPNMQLLQLKTYMSLCLAVIPDTDMSQGLEREYPSYRTAVWFFKALS